MVSTDAAIRVTATPTAGAFAHWQHHDEHGRQRDQATDPDGLRCRRERLACAGHVEPDPTDDVCGAGVP